jgi:hypothetical protein
MSDADKGCVVFEPVTIYFDAAPCRVAAVQYAPISDDLAEMFGRINGQAVLESVLAAWEALPEPDCTVRAEE